MLAEVFPVNGIIVLLSLAGLVVVNAAPVGAITKPTAAFPAAGSNKALWITVIVVFSIFTGLIGLILPIVYLAAIQPRMKGQRGAYSGTPGEGSSLRTITNADLNNPHLRVQ